MSQWNQFRETQKLQPISIDDYLKRIGLEQETPSLAFLKALHKAHLMHIPFENLDIFFQKKVLLDINEIFKKIILKKRGGIAFELNILFYHLLHHLEFHCSLVSAKWKQGDNWGRDLDHPIIIVQFDGEYWLIDVGSNSNFFTPKRIVTSQIQLDNNQYFRFVTDPDQNYILENSSDGMEYQPIYQFSPVSRTMIEFLERFYYYQESGDSPLRRHKLVSKYTQNGKVTLTDHELVIRNKGEEEKWPILQEDDFASKLAEYFGINYDQLVHQSLDE